MLTVGRVAASAAGAAPWTAAPATMKAAATPAARLERNFIEPPGSLSWSVSARRGPTVEAWICCPADAARHSQSASAVSSPLTCTDTGVVSIRGTVDLTGRNPYGDTTTPRRRTGGA